MSSNIFYSLRNTLMALSIISLYGCGGGGGFVGIDGSGQKPVNASGPINGFGSVIVNGVHYNTDDAEIYVKGQPADEYELDLGDFVTVIGYTTGPYEGVAERIYYQPKLSGTVEWVDIENDRFGMLSQTVIVDSDTLFDGTLYPKNINAIKVGSKLSISGSSDANQLIRATRIEAFSAEEVEISGNVAKLDPVARTFFLNGVKINYSNVAEGQKLKAGSQVMVSGRTTIYGGISATWIDFSLDNLSTPPIILKEISGYVSGYNGSDSFFVDGVKVTFNSDTPFFNGNRNLLANNHKIKVAGVFESNILKAESIEFIYIANIQITGEIEEVELIENNFHQLGWMTVKGNRFAVMRNTFLQIPYDRYVTLDEFEIGSQVTLSAFYHNYSPDLTASSITAIWDNQQEFVFEQEVLGPAYVYDMSSQSFIVFGTTINLSEDTEFFGLAEGLSMEQKLQAINGKYVKVRGNYSLVQWYHFDATSVKITDEGSIPPPPPMWY